MIPIVIPVRKQSQRCFNKVLRPFYGDLSLLDICCMKFGSRAYIAAHEGIFNKIAELYGSRFIQRTKESSLSEDNKIIHNYLKDFPFDIICCVNVCCPLLKPETVFEAIKKFESSNFKSLFSVKRTSELIFDSTSKIVNSDNVFNSRERKTNYIGTNSILIYNKKKLLEAGLNWDYTENNPYLFKIDEIEGLDIDTELDFSIAKYVYAKQRT